MLNLLLLLWVKVRVGVKVSLRIGRLSSVIRVRVNARVGVILRTREHESYSISCSMRAMVKGKVTDWDGTLLRPVLPCIIDPNTDSS